MALTKEKITQIRKTCNSNIGYLMYDKKTSSAEKALDLYAYENRSNNPLVARTNHNTNTQEFVYNWAVKRNYVTKGDLNEFDLDYNGCKLHVYNGYFTILDLSKYGSKVAKLSLRELNIQTESNNFAEAYTQYLEEIEAAADYIFSNYNKIVEKKEKREKRFKLNLGIIKSYLTNHFKDKGVDLTFKESSMSLQVKLKVGKYEVRYLIYSSKANSMEQELTKIEKLIDAFKDLDNRVAIKRL